MIARSRSFLLGLNLILLPFLVSAQPQSPSASSPPGEIVLDVVVTHKSGPPVVGLEQADFTVLDNKTPQTITSFHRVDGRQAPVSILLVVDGVNANYQNIAFERGQIDQFLRADGGNLAYPTALAVLTDRGVQMGQGFSTDGNALSVTLDQSTVGLRTVRPSQGIYGADEILQQSLQNLQELLSREASRPGRKIILWVSPGWPLLSGPRIDLSNQQEEQIFKTFATFSNEFLQWHITLDSVDPLGTVEGLRAFFWQDFAKPIAKPSQARPGHLSLQALANQSGGLVATSNNNIDALLRQCLANIAVYYEISFTPPPATKPNEFHQLEIRVAKPGLTARTLQSYYLQP